MPCKSEKCPNEPEWRLTAETEGFRTIHKGAQRNSYACGVHLSEETQRFKNSLSGGYKGLPFGNVQVAPLKASAP